MKITIYQLQFISVSFYELSKKSNHIPTISLVKEIQIFKITENKPLYKFRAALICLFMISVGCIWKSWRDTLLFHSHFIILLDCKKY